MKPAKMLGVATNDGRTPATPPTLTFMAMHTDAIGQSALAFDELAGFTSGSLGGGSAALWLHRFAGVPTELWFTVLPVGWVGEWHESPARQWVLALSGRWWIETATGQRIEMGPGEIHWGQDIGTDGRHGHRSGQTGDEPCIQLMIRYTGPAADVPSWPFGASSQTTG